MSNGINLGKAWVQIVPSAEGITGSITKVLNSEMTSAGVSAGSVLSSGISTGLVAGAGAIAAGVGLATAAVGKLTSEAYSSYANYEQLVGGVEKLYGSAAEKLEQFANEAYKTSGMSANQYMETATSFSAALINSLNGDVDKAADLTDVAMRAMSDNVNIFGSDMSSVQNAFQGFAKQNYTMLDNLKLGYGGTKSEMERLIADANTYRASIGETADLSIDSFADIVQAIQSVQEAQNIAGTTNKEAMSTLEGSATAVQAAWQNVITTIGRGEGIAEAIQGLTDSIFGTGGGGGLLDNVIPRIQTIFEGIAQFVETAGPIIGEKIPPLIESIVPTLMSSASNLIMNLTQALIEGLPSLLNTGMMLLIGLVDGISQALPNLIPAALEAILVLVESLLDHIDQLIDCAGKLIIGLAEGLIKALPKLIDQAPIIIKKFVQALLKLVPEVLKVAVELIAKLATGILANVGKLLTAGADIIRNLFNTIKNAIGNFHEIGSNIVEGIKNGISNAWSNMVSWFKGLFGDLTAIAKDILGIASPSKVFRQIGEYTVEGFDEGMSGFGVGAMQDVQDAMDEISTIRPSIDPADLKSNVSADYNIAASGSSDIASKLDALIALMSNETNVNVFLQGDAQGLFRTVRKEVNQFTKSTGNSPFIAPA